MLFRSRASAALPGIYLLCASGLEELSKRSSFRWRWAFFPALLILPMWNSFRYVPTKLADSPAFFGEPKFSIPDSVLVPALGESNVEISDLLFNIDLERLAMTSTRSLYLKYGKNQSLGQILAWGKSAGCARKMDWKEFPGSRLIGTFEGRPLYAGKKLEGFCEGRAGS